MSSRPAIGSPLPKAPSPLNERPRSDRPFTRSQLLDVIHAASVAIEKAGYGYYLFGSAAVYFNIDSEHRMPGDIDLVVFAPSERLQRRRIDAERVKVDIQRWDSRFYRVKAKWPDANYTPFWFSFSEPPDLLRSIKVDIVPEDSETLKLPRVPAQKLDHLYLDEVAIDAVPLFTLFLLKIKGWHDRRHSRELWVRKKLVNDVIDIKALLAQVLRAHETVRSQNQKWLPPWFVEQSQEYAKEFLVANPEISQYAKNVKSWFTIGLIKRSDREEIRQKAGVDMEFVRDVQEMLQERYANRADAKPALDALERSLTRTKYCYKCGRSVTSPPG
ncbi:hypothetical protein V5O48_005430 [Marasmius crinis-equi]|uniref:Nucleotidyltransferase n=1 Tax=Marasmius crinis-equi TaxID=585013 RepID=A0ABR3FMS9_9AGAR